MSQLSLFFFYFEIITKHYISLTNQNSLSYVGYFKEGNFYVSLI
jgi:hypothetical protein